MFGSRKVKKKMEEKKIKRKIKIKEKMDLVLINYFYILF